MNSAITIEKISEILDPKAPIENVRTNWPLVQSALEAHGMTSDECMIAAIATIGVETGCFAPVKERGGPGYFVKMYWDDERERKELGNRSPDDAVAFKGRGMVQISGYLNYLNYGHAIGVDLVSNPDLALDPGNSAKILALYFRDHKIEELALADRWERVRREVNGGLNGWADFMKYVAGLKALIGQTVYVVNAAAVGK